MSGSGSAEDGGSVDAAKSLLKGPARLLFFRVPQTKNKVNFVESFHTTSGEEHSQALVVNLNTSRNNMHDSLLQSDVSNAVHLAAVDAYLPHIWQLLSSLEQQEPVRLDSPLTFEWRSGFGNTNNFVSFPDIIYDLIMTSATKAILLNNYAVELIQGDVNATNHAGKYFREASGIMNYLAGTLIPRWQNHAVPNKPTECFPEICRFLSFYFDACAHQMAIVKSITASSRPSLLSGLCVAGNMNMHRALDGYYRGNLPENVNVDDILLTHIAYERELLKAMSYIYLAEDQQTKEETGNAIGCCDYAIFLLNFTQSGKVYLPDSPGFPKKAEQDKDMKDNIKRLIEYAETMKAKAENENRIIYFKPIPKSNEDLPELPQAFYLKLDPIPYEQPSSEVIIFKYDESRKPPTIFGKITSLFK